MTSAVSASGECIAGALSWEELHSFSKEVGFSAPRLVTASKFVFKKDHLTDLLEGYKFVSATYRLFKLPSDAVKSASSVVYNGKIPHQANEMEFDHKYKFKTDERRTVDGELAAILSHSRFQDYFKIEPTTDKAPCCLKKDPFVYADENDTSGGGCCA